MGQQDKSSDCVLCVAGQWDWVSTAKRIKIEARINIGYKNEESF